MSGYSSPSTGLKLIETTRIDSYSPASEPLTTSVTIGTGGGTLIPNTQIVLPAGKVPAGKKMIFKARVVAWVKNTDAGYRDINAILYKNGAQYSDRVRVMYFEPGGSNIYDGGIINVEFMVESDGLEQDFQLNLTAGTSDTATTDSNRNTGASLWEIVE